MSKLVKEIERLENENNELSKYKEEHKKRELDYVSFPARMLVELRSQIDTGYREDYLPLFWINQRSKTVEFQADETDFNDQNKQIIITPQLANYITNQVLQKGIDHFKMDYAEGQARFDEDYDRNG